MTDTEGRSLRQLQGDFARAVAELTRPITRKIVRLNRETTEHTQPSLLEQLHTAVATGREAGGGAGGRGNPLVIDPDAADLLVRIDKEVSDVLRWARAQEPVVDRVAELAEMVGGWAEVELVEWAVNRVRLWVELIAEKLDPSRRMHIGAPCPACGEGMIYRELVGGERVLVPALQVDPVATTASCLACGHYWGSRQDLETLAVGIAERPARPRLRSSAEGNGHRTVTTTGTAAALPGFAESGELA
jgi:hypothetical protein